MSFSRAISVTAVRSLRSWWSTSWMFRQTGVEISSTDCISSGRTIDSSSLPSTAARTVSMCWTRSNVVESRSMYSSSTPSVYGSPLPNECSSTLPWVASPLLVMLGGTTLSMPGCYGSALGNDCVRLDFDQPARVEQRGHDQHRRRRLGLAEDLAVGAADLRPVLGTCQVDPRADDVLRACADLGERGHDDLQAAARLAVRVCGRFAAVGHDRRGAGDGDVVPHAHGA